MYRSSQGPFEFGEEVPAIGGRGGAKFKDHGGVKSFKRGLAGLFFFGIVYLIGDRFDVTGL